MAYEGQGLPGSGAIDSSLWLRDVARREDYENKLAAFHKDSIGRILCLRRRAYVATPELRRSIQRKLTWAGHAVRCHDGEPFIYTASHMAQANGRPVEDVGKQDNGSNGTSLRTTGLRLHTMEKGLDKRFQ